MIVKLTYFKQNGEFYGRAFYGMFTSSDADVIPMSEVIADVKDRAATGRLPELMPIPNTQLLVLVDAVTENDYPHLLLPHSLQQGRLF